MRFFRRIPRRRSPENIVPMINVVFLLLIFFLMTARITQPDPVEVTPPASRAEDGPREGATLYLAADGALAFRDARGQEVYSAIAGRPDEMLIIRADRGIEAGRLAAVLTRLAALGRDGALLVVGPR